MARKKKEWTPLWKGPCVDGITQSMLSLFLVCRERFRLRYLEGLTLPEKFNHRLEYGSMFHLCEEEHLAGRDWQKALLAYTRKLQKKFPGQQPEIVKWYNVCKVQFPVYVAYWKKNNSRRKEKTLLQECTFSAPYVVPGGKTVWLRGKWDSVKSVGKKVYLQENKTKGEVDDDSLTSQLLFDLQTGFYLTAMEEADLSFGKLGGVHYNVVLRPLSGGKHSIKPLKGNSKKPPETEEQFYERLGKEHIEADPEFFFHRWEVEVTKNDMDRFREEFLDNTLEELCCWYEEVVNECERGYSPFDCCRHYRTPYGIYNPLSERNRTEWDEYLENGSTTGLTKVDRLFTELD